MYAWCDLAAARQLCGRSGTIPWWRTTDSSAAPQLHVLCCAKATGWLYWLSTCSYLLVLAAGTGQQLIQLSAAATAPAEHAMLAIASTVCCCCAAKLLRHLPLAGMSAFSDRRVLQSSGMNAAAPLAQEYNSSSSPRQRQHQVPCWREAVNCRALHGAQPADRLIYLCMLSLS